MVGPSPPVLLSLGNGSKSGAETEANVTGGHKVAPETTRIRAAARRAEAGAHATLRPRIGAHGRSPEPKQSKASEGIRQRRRRRHSRSLALPSFRQSHRPCDLSCQSPSLKSHAATKSEESGRHFSHTRMRNATRGEGRGSARRRPSTLQLRMTNDAFCQPVVEMLTERR